MLNFNERCYSLLMQVPKGRVTTYAEIAHALGGKGYRAVGVAMAKNNRLIEVPCHRVVCSDGNMGGYVGGITQKRQLLESEGVKISNGKIVDFDQVIYRF
ncbi:MAG: MGMT family protein [Zetaproteobacteria bacterium]|nr:MGMT family protein [Zetaproteobacteria bacterium]